MRILFVIVLLSGFVYAQEAQQAASPTLSQGEHSGTHQVTIPAGTKIPIALKNTISTKANHEGDPIYAQTTFPVVIDDRVVVPPGTYVQGKISSIIAAKPVERRLLLEEAAGISGLHARRKDAEQKLRAAEANLTRLGEILSEQEQRAAQLRRQARAAERYRKLTEQIRGVEARLLHARWVEAEQAAEAATAEAKASAEEV